MILTAAVVLLAQTVTTTPTPAPPPAPAKLSGGFGRAPAAPGKAQVVVTEQNLAPTGKGRGSFSVVGAPIAALPTISTDASPEAKAAQERMNRAVERGYWTAGNITYNQRLRDAARSEWDAAEAACRRTPGCTPTSIPSGLLPTGEETLEKIHGNRFRR